MDFCLKQIRLNATDPNARSGRTARPVCEGMKAQDGLILDQMHQVRAIGWRIFASIGRRVDLEDLISCGTLGLIEAVGRFDPNRGVKLSTFAAPHIRGRILDFLRRARPTRRGQQCDVREVPIDSDLVGSNSLALKDPGDSPLEIFSKSDESRRLAKCISFLPGEERAVIQLHFYEGVRMDQVAAILKCCTATAYGLRRQAVIQLKTDLLSFPNKWLN